MDDADNLMATPESDVENHRIRPCRILELDRESYAFKVPAIAKEQTPNAVHVLRSHSEEIHRAEWSPTGMIKLDDTSLETLRGNGGFSGF